MWTKRCKEHGAPVVHIDDYRGQCIFECGCKEPINSLEQRALRLKDARIHVQNAVAELTLALGGIVVDEQENAGKVMTALNRIFSHQATATFHAAEEAGLVTNP